MRRILHIVGRMDRAGAETMVMTLYRAIDKEQLQFDFLYFTDDTCDFDEEILALGGRIFRLSPYQFRNTIARMRALKSLLLDNRDIVAVHCHMLLNNAFHLLAAQQAGVPIRIAHSHSTVDLHKHNASPLRKLYEFAAKRLIKRYATRRVSCGILAAEYLFGTQTNVLLLNNAVDVASTITQASDKGYLRKLVHASEDELILIQVARFTHVKNHKFSIEVLRALVEQDARVRLVFAGDGPLTKTIREHAANLGVLDHVNFLGLRSDIPRLMGGADVMLLPSFHEGFPLVLVESQTIGLPALVSDKVAQEVDLGIGLVEVSPIQSGVAEWCKKIVLITKNQSTSQQANIAEIRRQGFDVSTNIRLLEDIYRE